MNSAAVPLRIDEDEAAAGEPKKCRIQQRHIVMVLAFFGFANVYAMRANLSVAIVQMTSDIITTVNGETVVRKAEFPYWDSVAQGAILGAFFYGYLFTQVPGGYLAHRFGGKYVYCIGIFGTAFFTLLTPPVARLGKFYLMAARFIEGFFEGATYPAMHTILGHWAPSSEKTRMTSVSYAGAYFGTVVAMPLSAFLGRYFGWPAIFYFFGIVAMLWCVFWVKLFYDLPENNPYISSNELALLKRETKEGGNETVPWSNILRSKAVWAIMVAHVCQNWGTYTMLAYLPRILKNLLDYNHEKAGSLSAVPYLAMGVLLLIAGSLADFLRQRYKWSTILARKVFCCLGLIGQAVFILIAMFKTWEWLVLFSLIASVGLGGLTFSAFSVNSLDIAPQYAGHLMGLSNTLATMPGMFSPLFVGAVVRNELLNEWRIVFIFTAGIFLFGATVFAIFAKGEVQKWASGSTAVADNNN